MFKSLRNIAKKVKNIFKRNEQPELTEKELSAQEEAARETYEIDRIKKDLSRQIFGTAIKEDPIIKEIINDEENIYNKKIRKIKRFFNNPKDKAYINISDVEWDEVSKLIKINIGFRLILKVGENYITISNQERLDKLKNIIEDQELEFRPEFVSDAPLVLDYYNLGELTFSMEEIKEKYRPFGGYFKWYHNLKDFDLTKYQIFANKKEANYSDNCLQAALIAGGLEQEKFDVIKNILQTRDIPMKSLKQICSTIKIQIKLTKSDRKVIRYGSEGKIYNIGLIENHFFIIDETEFTSFSIKNYKEINEIEDFNHIYKKTKNNKYAKDTSRTINSFNLIILLLELKSELLTPITFSNATKDNTFNETKNGMSDYKKLSDITFNKLFDITDNLSKTEKSKRIKDNADILNNNEARLVEYKELSSIFGKKDEDDFDVKYFDTETTIDGSIHKAYLICSNDRKTKEKLSFDGNKCIINWLNTLTKNTLLIAHNLRYDIQFLISELIIEDGSMIKTGSQIKSFKAKFYNKEKALIINLVFKDSVSFITNPLSDFGKMFNLKVKKEIMPYYLYTEESIAKKYIRIDSALGIDHYKNKQILNEEDYKGFVENIDSWGLRIQNDYFDHIEYSRLYCELDCEVLRQGYEIFRDQMLEVTLEDIDKAVSLPQIANVFGRRMGVYDGCYETRGMPRDFMQRCLVGGRTMIANNTKKVILPLKIDPLIKERCNQFELLESRFKCLGTQSELVIAHKNDDFDGVSLYPSAMARMPGILKGLPKVITEDIIKKINSQNTKDISGYFAEIEILDIGKYRDFPLISKINNKGTRDFSNDIRGDGIYVDKVTLEDLIKFQEIKFRVIRGYYYDDGFNTKLKPFIINLFNERVIKKKEKNIIEKVYKLIMNAFYGKNITKPIEYDYTFKDTIQEMEKFVRYNFNTVKEAISISSNGNKFMIKSTKPIQNHFNMCHTGIEILSYSKRIMNEVICLAQDLGIEIYYTDTDSIEIDARKIYDGLSGKDKLDLEFKKIYDRPLNGNELGQFNADFDFKSDREVLAEGAVFLGKKSYCCRIPTWKNGIKSIEYHSRLKGIPNASLLDEANENYNGDQFAMYLDMANGKEITFNLISKLAFKSNKNFTTGRHDKFTRKLKF